MSRYRSYHGATHGAMALTGDSRRWAIEPGTMGGVVRLFDPDPYRSLLYREGDTLEEFGERMLEQMEETMKYENPDAIAAILLESVTGLYSFFFFFFFFFFFSFLFFSFFSFLFFSFLFFSFLFFSFLFFSFLFFSFLFFSFLFFSFLFFSFLFFSFLFFSFLFFSFLFFSFLFFSFLFFSFLISFLFSFLFFSHFFSSFPVLFRNQRSHCSTPQLPPWSSKTV